MDSKEDILAALEEFNLKDGDKVPPLLERYLNRIAATGETLFAWTKLRPLFLHKLDEVMREFFEKVPTDDLPHCPNVENVKFEEIRQRLMVAIGEFNGAPFTIQRLCELITNPQKHYKRTDKFMRGIEKNLLVVSTVDPYGNKIVNESSKSLVNGLDANGYETDKISPDTPDRSFFPPPAPTSSPSTNGAGVHSGGVGDVGPSSTQPVSSWFASSAGDTVCPWGTGTTPGMVDSSNGDVMPSSSTPTASATTTASPVSTNTSTPSSQLGPMEPQMGSTSSGQKDTELSESSSESSGSSSSTTPPPGDIDKDSEDSNESAKTSESSSSDSSLNEAEAEQSHHHETHQPPVSEELPADKAPAVDPVTTSSHEDSAMAEATTGSDEVRESGKRSIEQDHNETANKRPRIEEDVSQSTDIQSSSAQPTDTQKPSQNEPLTSADSQEDSTEKMEEESSQREAQPAEIQEGRDSQDSLGFDVPVGSDSEAVAAEDSHNAEEPASSSTPDTDSAPNMDSSSSPTKDDVGQPGQDDTEAACTAEGGEMQCEVSASDQSEQVTDNKLPTESALSSASSSAAAAGDLAQSSSKQTVNADATPTSASVTLDSTPPTATEQQQAPQNDNTPKQSDNTTPEPESTSSTTTTTTGSQSDQSNSVTPATQSQCEEVSQSSTLQTESAMDAN